MNKEDPSTKNLIKSKSEAMQPQFHFIAHKAGMDGLDQEKILKIVMEASKNSEYYKKQVEKKIKNEEKLDEIKKKIENSLKDKTFINNIQKVIEKKFQNYEKERNLSRLWVHFDLDMFYVACEIRDDLNLKDKPVAVGSMSMISTANYIARKFGVRSAMPGFIGKKLCPELILIPHNGRKYSETSAKFKAIIEKYDLDNESMGLDEANLDMTGYLQENNISKLEDIEKLCKDIRMQINEATGITVSCGIGPNKMIAKICSDVNKPNGQFMLKSNTEDILDFMYKMSIRKIPGIGNMNEQVLNGMGIQSCKDMIEKALEIYLGYSDNAFEFFIKSALGIARCYHELPEDRKSVSVSETFQAMHKIEDIQDKIQELAEYLANDLLGYKKLAKQITLTLKTYEFDVKCKILTLEKYSCDVESIANAALKLFKDLQPVKPLRLIGIKGGDLINEDQLHSALDKYFKPKTHQPSSPKKYHITLNEASNHEFPKKSPEADLNTFLGIPSDISNMSLLSPDRDSINESSKNSLMNQISKGNNNGNPSHSNTSESALNSKSIMTNEVICPVCNMKFESTINKTRINNHIDKCLMASLINETSELSGQSDIKNVDENLNKQSSKRKAKTNLEPPNVNSKKIKKNNEENLNKEKNNMVDKFFNRINKK